MQTDLDQIPSGKRGTIRERQDKMDKVITESWTLVSGVTNELGQVDV